LQFEVGEVTSIIVASIILTLLVDLPFQEAKKILWQKGKYLQSAALRILGCLIKRPIATCIVALEITLRLQYSNFTQSIPLVIFAYVLKSVMK
jgi:hypothetical protein